MWTQIAGMFQPVRCARCGGVYDLGTVEVTASYADCQVWRAPCCGATVDSRPWKSQPDYRHIDKNQPYGPIRYADGRVEW